MPQASTDRTAAGRAEGIGLRTANTLLHARGHGIVLDEPSEVAVRAGPTGALAVGADGYLGNAARCGGGWRGSGRIRERRRGPEETA